VVTASLYREALRRTTFQIQCTTDLEARAYAQQRTTLLLALQDPEASAWYARQARCAVLRENVASVGMPAQSVTDRACLPIERGAVQRVDLRGDVALVELVTDPGQLRVVRFYRQTERGWVHTVPVGAFWGDAVQVSGDGVIVHGVQRDLRHLERVRETVAALRSDLCAKLDCSAAPLEVHVDAETLAWPEAASAQIALLSPSLVGLREDGALSAAYRDELAVRTAYVLLSQWVGADRGGWTNLLQRSIVEQVAAAYGRGQAAGIPILSHVIARHGDGVVPAVVASLRGMDDLSQFLSCWFGATPDDPERYSALLVEMMNAPALSSYDATVQLLVDTLEEGDLVDEWAGTAQ
jgi:hypothetical protein